MKKIVFLIVILLILPVVMSYSPAAANMIDLRQPFAICERVGLLPEIQQDIDIIRQKMDERNATDGEGLRLFNYLSMEEECCELTVDEQACIEAIEEQERQFQDSMIKRGNISPRDKLNHMLRITISSLLILVSIGYLVFFQKKVKKEKLRVILRNLAILILGLSVIFLIMALAGYFTPTYMLI